MGVLQGAGCPDLDQDRNRGNEGLVGAGGKESVEKMKDSPILWLLLLDEIYCAWLRNLCLFILRVLIVNELSLLDLAYY